MSNLISNMYETKSDLIILGLTGRTGSGCSTLAKILKKSKYEQLDIRSDKTRDFNDTEEIKSYIVNNYIKNCDRWKSFTVIEVSSILVYLIFNYSGSSFDKYIDDITDNNKKTYVEIPDLETFKNNLISLRYIYDEFREYKELYDYIEFKVDKCKEENLPKYIKFLTESLVSYRDQFKKVLRQFVCNEIIDNGVNGKEKKEIIYIHISYKL